MIGSNHRDQLGYERLSIGHCKLCVENTDVYKLFLNVYACPNFLTKQILAIIYYTCECLHTSHTTQENKATAKLFLQRHKTIEACFMTFTA